MLEDLDLGKAEKKLEKLVQIEDKRVRRFDESVARVNSEFGHFLSGVDGDDEDGPNEELASDLMTDIKRLKKEGVRLNSLFEGKRKITYPMLIPMNADFSLKAQETFIRFFLDPYSDDPANQDKYIDTKKLLNDIFAVDAYARLLHASKTRDRKLSNSCKKRMEEIESHELNCDSNESRAISDKILNVLQVIGEEFAEETYKISKVHSIKPVLSPPGEKSSSWSGDTAVMEISSSAFHYYKSKESKGDEKCYLGEALDVTIEELVAHRIHEWNSEFMSTSTQANDSNHNNLVSWPLTEGIPFLVKYDFLRYLDKNFLEVNEKFRKEVGRSAGVKVYRKDLRLMKDLVRLYAKTQSHSLILPTELIGNLSEKERAIRKKLSLRKKRGNNQENHLSELHCQLKNKEHDGKRYSKILYSGSYYLGERHIHDTYIKLNRDYGRRVVEDNESIFNYIVMMGDWAIPVHRLWVDLALGGLGFKKRKK